MKGENKIQMNQATMVEAVQMYLNSQFAEGKAPTVVSVDANKSAYSGDTFDVVATEKVEIK